MSTFSVWYVSSVTGQLCRMSRDFRRAELREAFDTFRWHANSGWRAASAWILKRGGKRIARRDVDPRKVT